MKKIIPADVDADLEKVERQMSILIEVEESLYNRAREQFELRGRLDLPHHPMYLLESSNYIRLAIERIQVWLEDK